MTKKKVLITGITGQCGSYFAEIVLENECEVIGMKRRTSLLDAHRRLDHVYSNPNLKLVYGNLSDTGSIWKIINEFKPDIIVNFAAQSHVKTSFDVSEETLDVVGIGPLRILNAMKELCPKAKFYQASSSEQFGNSPCPKTGYVETSLMSPCSPYSAAKLAAYNIVRNYRESYGLFAINGILFNNESNRRGETFITRKITLGVARIKLGLQDKIHVGNMDAYRDWGHSKDYMKGVWLMLQQDKPEDFILASGETHTVREMCEYVFSLAGLDYKNYVETDQRLFRPQEVPYLLGDSTKAREKLGWKPKYSFEELLKEMYESDLKLIAEQNNLDYRKYL